jgi:putative ABC transport system permease protein
MGTLLQDLRYALRTLARQPRFTLVAVLTLAIGIGANTAIYSVVDATLLRTLPYRDPDRLMRLYLTMPAFHGRGPADDMVWSYPKYQVLRQGQTAFQDTAIYVSSSFNLTGTGEPDQLRAETVSASYFPVLGAEAQVGRTFRPDEDVIMEKDLVAVISHSLWERRFGSDPQIAGKTIGLDQHRFTIVGVMPAAFQPLSGPADVWVPVHSNHDPGLETQAQSHYWECVARLKDGVSAAQAQREVAALGSRIEAAYPRVELKGWGAKARTLEETRLDPLMRRSILVLFGAVGAVLLIACVNVANLVLARGASRQREIAVRLAVGASRTRLVRQLLTESIVLAVIGAAASLALAWWGVRVLSAFNPGDGNPFAFGRRLPGLAALGAIHLDSRALLFTLAAAVLSGILFGLAPAVESSRGTLEGLRGSGGRTIAAGGKSALVVVEIALAVVLLIGATLMLKSFGRLIATRSGIDPENVLTLRISVRNAQAPAAATAFFHELESRVSALPGVLSAGMSNCHAFAGACNSTLITFPDRPPVPRGTEPGTGAHFVSPAYFRAMKIPLLRGRWFKEADGADAPKVIVISETAARRFWPGEDPIGKRAGIGQGFRGDAEVVGVVGDVRYGQVDEPPKPDVYESYLQAIGRTGMILFVRTTGNPAALLPAIQREVRTLNSDQPVYDVKTMNERIRDATARSRFSALLLAVFAAIALLLAAVGIYGVMAYLVTERTREIGIRVALGAGSRDVLAMVLRRGAILSLAGIALGVAGSLAATRILRTMLYEVKPEDPSTYCAVSLLLAAVALAASYIPARRACAVDAATALRSD